MKSIWKYALDIVDEQSILIPQHRKFLSLQVQNSGPVVWFLVDPETTKEPVTFDMFGTGQPIERFVGNFLATLQFGRLVFHVFER